MLHAFRPRLSLTYEHGMYVRMVMERLHLDFSDTPTAKLASFVLDVIKTGTADADKRHCPLYHGLQMVESCA